MKPTLSLEPRIKKPMLTIPDEAVRSGVFHLNRDSLGSPIRLRDGVTIQYETPPDRKRSILDRVLFRSDLAFLIGYFREIFASRKQCLKNEYTDEVWLESSGRILDVIEGCEGKFKIEGIEHVISPQGPVVFAGNHMSVLETFVFPYFLVAHRPVTYVVKESLVNGKVFGPIMRSRNPIAVGRTNPREDLVKVLEEGTAILKGGTSIVVFPQSTRTRTFDPSEFNSIAVKLASRAGVPVVPFAVKTDFWQNGKLLKDIGSLVRNRMIHMKFGTPLSVATDSRKNQEILLQFVLKNLKEWGVEIKNSTV
ncbi:acyltransferase [Leptospira broomii serovar Hurstbridge str. 5399]|uniref:Acyltransferase n=1 Tax=Leptospira broomii serovar Hurstbridge str. 5399 TaxID=1049789 RepID=T0F785_9LEPT|nr:lysophospholipid acyltransferase family protein [Leptospira broomii]EQA43377.1 acyltransferase [Leptospira broomii serovar Hurstbridge str. 5399]